MRSIHVTETMPRLVLNLPLAVATLLITSMSSLVTAASGGAGSGGIPEASPPELLLSECLIIDEEEILNLFGQAIDDEGNWAARIFATGTVDDVLFYNGAILAREDDPAPAPPGTMIRNFNLMSTNGKGQLTVLFEVSPGINTIQRLPDRDNPLLSTFELVAIEGDPAPNTMPGSTLTSLGRFRLNNAGQLMTEAGTDDPSAENILYLWNLPASGPGIANSVRIATDGEILPGQTDPVTNFPSADEWNLNIHDNALFRASGDTFDAIYSWDGSLAKVTQVGEPAPVAGRVWADFGNLRMSLGNQGDILIRAEIDSDQTTDGLLALNGVKWIQEGDPTPGIVGSPPLKTVEDAPVKIDDLGRIIWQGSWIEDPMDFPDRDALFVDHTPVIVEHSTLIEGEVDVFILSLVNIHSFSDNGRYLIFNAIYGTLEPQVNIDPCLRYPLEGVFRIDLMPPLFADGFETGDFSEWSATVP